MLFFRILQQVMNFTKLIILARVLHPRDFGMLGIALLILATLETFSRTGFQQALIQRKGDVTSYLHPTWTVQAVRGVVLCAILFICAPYIASFFEAPDAEPIVKAICIILIFQGFTSAGMIIIRKELLFNKQFLFNFVGSAVDFIVAVAAAFILRSVWALVLGMLAGNLVKAVISYFIHPYRPKISTDFKKMGELFRFGKWILGSSIVVFLITQGDDFFVGKLLSATMLGCYQMAYRISNTPATEITRIISQVSFPAYSKIQENKQRLTGAFGRVLNLTSFLSFGIAGLIFALSKDFVIIFMGDKWLPIITPMRVLVGWGIIRSLVGTTSPIFHAIGRPQTLTKLQTLQAALMFLIIYPLTIRYGISGTAAAVLLSASVFFFIRNHIFVKIMGMDLGKFYREMIWPCFFGIISYGAVSLWKFYLPERTGIFNFGIMVLIYSCIYLGLSLYVVRTVSTGFREFISRVMGSRGASA